MASPQTTDDVASPPVVTCVDLARVAAGNGNGNGFGKIKRIAVMTAGGDCPGLNATIRAISFDAFGNGIDVLGVEDGILGLIEDRIKPIRMEDVREIAVRGGTVLGSNNKTDPTRFPTGKRNPDGTLELKDVTALCAENLRRRGVDALVAIGGDGTMSAVKPITEHGINCIGVPKTIDCDLYGSDITVGFQTAVETGTEALDRLRTTASSHHRIMVVELMGRHAGWITLHAGIAAGASVILIPEIEFDIETVCKRCLVRSSAGDGATIIAVAEGARPSGGHQIVERVVEDSPDPIRLGGVAKWLAKRIEDRTGLEARYVVLGHVLRGGQPCAADRVLAARFGHHAVNLLLTGMRNRLVVARNGELHDVDITSAANKQRLVPPTHSLVLAARALLTCFGDVPCHLSLASASAIQQMAMRAVKLSRARAAAAEEAAAAMEKLLVEEAAKKAQEPAPAKDEESTTHAAAFK